MRNGSPRHRPAGLVRTPRFCTARARREESATGVESDSGWEDNRVNARQAPVSSYDEALKLRRGTKDSASKATENWYDHISLDPCFFCFGLDYPAQHQAHPLKGFGSSACTGSKSRGTFVSMISDCARLSSSLFQIKSYKSLVSRTTVPPPCTRRPPTRRPRTLL